MARSYMDVSTVAYAIQRQLRQMLPSKYRLTLEHRISSRYWTWVIHLRPSGSKRHFKTIGGLEFEDSFEHQRIEIWRLLTPADASYPQYGREVVRIDLADPDAFDKIRAVFNLPPYVR